MIPFKDEVFESLESLVKNFEKNMGDTAFKGSLKTYWMEQIEYQEAIRDGVVLPDGHEWSPLQKCGVAGAGENTSTRKKINTHASMTFPRSKATNLLKANMWSNFT